MKKSDKKNQKIERKVGKKAGEKDKESKNTGSKAGLVIILISVFMGIVVILSFVLVCLNAMRMEEISKDDEDVQELLTRYFFSDGGCSNYDYSLLRDGRFKISDLSQEQKEHILVDFLLENIVEDVTYLDMNMFYKALFGQEENLAKRAVYNGTSGSVTSYRENEAELLDTDEYYMEEDCGKKPEFTTCIYLNEAYKNAEKGDIIKLVLRAFSVNYTGGDIVVHSGIDKSAESIIEKDDNGKYDLGNGNLERWEVFFRYDPDYETYIFTYSRKI